MNKILFLGIFLLLSACTHSLHIAHVSDFSPTFKEYSQGEWVKASAEQFVVLGIVTETNYINEAYGKLMRACPQGNIQGIVTQASTSHGFFSWTNRVDMQGLCVRN